MTINALDHIAIVVNDLDAAESGNTRLFGPTPNWRRPSHADRPACFPRPGARPQWARRARGACARTPVT